jgi:hypothetical protein
VDLNLYKSRRIITASLVHKIHWDEAPKTGRRSSVVMTIEGNTKDESVNWTRNAYASDERQLEQIVHGHLRARS